MKTQRSGFLFIGVTLLVLAFAGSAGAKPKVPKLLKLSVHSSFAGNEPITFRWRTDRAMRKGEAYKVTLSTSGTPERDGPACSTPQIVRRLGAGTPRGRTITVRFAVPKSGRWCPTRSAGVSVETYSGIIGSASFTLRDSRGLVPPEGYMWGRMTFAPSSTITVKVPGRPDRTAPLTAQIDQETYANPKNPYATTGDSIWVNSSGTVTPGPLAADPLCTAAPIAPLSVDRSTTLYYPALRSTGSPPIELTLVLRAGAAALTGCAADGPAPALTTVLLTGAPNPAPGTGLRVTGSVDGVHLAGGGVATVAFDITFTAPTPPFPAEY
jgi:hypothetical protein